MFEIAVKGHFDAAHALRGYKGKCEETHGHRFEVVVGVRGQQLNDIGILYDFAELKGKLRGVLEELDHHFLNQLPAFQEANPSSENLAQYIYRRLGEGLGGSGVELVYVEVWESPDNRVRFQPG